MTKKSLFMLVFALGALIFSGACASAPVDRQLGFQAFLTDSSGVKVPNGNYTVTVSFWDSPTSTDSGDKIFEESQTAYVTDGVLNIAIPDTTAEADALNPIAFAQPLWAEITINGEKLSPRQKLLGTPYAFSLVGGALVQVNPGYVQPLIDNAPEQGAFNILNRYSIDDAASPDPGTTGLVVAILDATDSQIIRACSGASGCSDTYLKFLVKGDGNVTADGSFTGGGADYAEMIALEGEAEPGDVLSISPSYDRTVTKSSIAYDTAFAGVFSTDPGFVGGGAFEEQPGMVPMAITGIVPVKITTTNGPIHRGDLLTTANLPGYAMLATEPEFGTIIGKAMGELLEGEGLIDVLLLSK